MSKIEGDRTFDKSGSITDSEKLRLRLLQTAHRMFTPRSAEAIDQDRSIGKAYREARRGKDLTRRDVADIMGTLDFGRDEVALFEQGLISIRDIAPKVVTRMVGIVPEVLDSQPFRVIRNDENFKFLLEGGQNG